MAHDDDYQPPRFDNPHITAVTRLEDALAIEFNSTISFQLPYNYLRDCCPTAFDKQTGCRVFSITDFADVPVPQDAGLVRGKGRNQLVVLWGGKSESYYDSHWLYQKCLLTWQSVQDMTMQFCWGAELTGKIATFQYRDIMGDDKTQLRMLEALGERDGVAIIRAAPQRQLSLKEIGQRLFSTNTLMRESSTLVDVDDPKTVGRGSRPLHSELSYCIDSPSVLAMLCVKMKATKEDENMGNIGGDILLVDGHMLAKNLEAAFPADFEVLCQYQVAFSKEGSRPSDLLDMRAIRPIFHLNCNGAVNRICYDEQHRLRWEGTPTAAGVWLSALHTASTAIYSETLVVSQPMMAGDILLLDSRRVLWGQAPFRTGLGIQCAYESAMFSMDDALSRARAIRRHVLGETKGQNS